MQAGQMLTGKQGRQYRIIKPLGRPGLFGQAFLCQQADTRDEYVVKALRGDATPETRERMFQEARTLEQIAAIEQKRSVHYAVRLIDESDRDAAEPFIILERATGKNVLDDLVEHITDWYKAPLPEPLVLDIAVHFAQALSYVHEAGLAYNDMKLDNLFWRSDQPRDPLRIIDWNVTTELRAAPQELVNDWARFGARLHHLYTGISIGLDRNGVIVGKRPSGMLWERTPYGIRALIEKALSKGYTSDEQLLTDLKRERDQASADVPALLRLARAADGRNAEVPEILAPLWRAEHLLAADSTSQKDELLKEIKELRQRGLIRLGQISDDNLQQLEQLLLKGERSLALDQAERLHRRVQEANPQVRRWLWVTQFATARPDLYAQFSAQLLDALKKFQSEDYAAARKILTNMLGSGDELFDNFNYEASAYEAAQAQQYQTALERLNKVIPLGHTKDLLVFKETLEQQQRLQEGQAADRASAAAIYKDTIASSKIAQQKFQQAQDAHDYVEARTETQKAIKGLADLQRNYQPYLPEIEQGAERLPSGDDLIRNRERLDAIIALRNTCDKLLQHQTASTIKSPMLADRINFIEHIQPIITAFEQKREAVRTSVSEDQWQQVQRALQISDAEMVVAQVRDLQTHFVTINAYREMSEGERAIQPKEKLTELTDALDFIQRQGITQFSAQDVGDNSLQRIEEQVKQRLAELDPVSRKELEDELAQLTEQIRQIQETFNLQLKDFRQKLSATDQLTEQLRQTGKTFTQQLNQRTEELKEKQEAQETAQRDTTSATDFSIALSSGDYERALAVIKQLAQESTNFKKIALALKLLNAVVLHLLNQTSTLSYTDFANLSKEQPLSLHFATVEKLADSISTPADHCVRTAIELGRNLSLSELKERAQQTSNTVKDAPPEISNRLKRIQGIAEFFRQQYENYPPQPTPEADLDKMEAYVTSLERNQIAVEHVQELPYAQTLYERAKELYKSDLRTSKQESDPRRREEAEERCERWKRIREALPAKKKDDELARLEAELAQVDFEQRIRAARQDPTSALATAIRVGSAQQLQSALDRPDSATQSKAPLWQWGAVALVLMLVGVSAFIPPIRKSIQAGLAGIGILPPAATATPLAATATPPPVQPKTVTPTPNVPVEVALSALSDPISIPRITTSSVTTILVFPNNTTQLTISKEGGNWRIPQEDLYEQLVGYLAEIQSTLATDIVGNDGNLITNTYPITLTYANTAVAVLTLNLDVKQVSGIPATIPEEDQLRTTNGDVLNVIPLRSEPEAGSATIIRIEGSGNDAIAVSPDDVVLVIQEQNDWYRVQIVRAADPQSNPADTTVTISRQGWIKKTYIP